jgi:hypothetical protein
MYFDEEQMNKVMSENLKYCDEIYNNVVHPSLITNQYDPDQIKERELDREIYGRFSELILISMDYIFGYAYNKGQNKCTADRGSLIALRAMAVMLALSGQKTKDQVENVVNILSMPGITPRKLYRYIRRYNEVIRKEYGDTQQQSKPNF